VADLEPETLDSLELGVRYRGDRVFFDVAAWYMRKRHVIFRDAQGINVSDGKTRHLGLEYLADWRIRPNLSATLRGTWARHTYRFDRAIGGGETIISGDDVDSAPRHVNQATLRWDYYQGGTAELEWIAVGSYYMDAANTVKYDGHQLFNLRVRQRLSRRWQGAFRITNLTDKSYAERADFAFGNYRYLPGQDRAFFLEIRFLGN
jgi:outer membrane receptor protein involved in Fe transport